MNSSAICSLTIMMLCLIHSPSLASAARSLGEPKQSLIAEICNELRDNNCVEILKASDPKIEEANKASELAKAILNIGSKKASEAHDFIKGLTKSNNSPGMIQCEEIYHGVAIGFKMVSDEIKTDSETADYDVSVMADEPARCVRILADEHIVNPDITAFYNQIARLSALGSHAISRLGI